MSLTFLGHRNLIRENYDDANQPLCFGESDRQRHVIVAKQIIKVSFKTLFDLYTCITVNELNKSKGRDLGKGQAGM